MISKPAMQNFPDKTKDQDTLKTIVEETKAQNMQDELVKPAKTMKVKQSPRPQPDVKSQKQKLLSVTQSDRREGSSSERAKELGVIGKSEHEHTRNQQSITVTEPNDPNNYQDKVYVYQNISDNENEKSSKRNLGSIRSSSQMLSNNLQRGLNNRFVYTSLSEAIQKFEEYDGHQKRLQSIGRNKAVTITSSSQHSAKKSQNKLSYGFSQKDLTHLEGIKESRTKVLSQAKVTQSIEIGRQN